MFQQTFDLMYQILEKGKRDKKPKKRSRSTKGKRSIKEPEKLDQSKHETIKDTEENNVDIKNRYCNKFH